MGSVSRFDGAKLRNRGWDLMGGYGPKVSRSEKGKLWAGVWMGLKLRNGAGWRRGSLMSPDRMWQWQQSWGPRMKGGGHPMARNLNPKPYGTKTASGLSFTLKL